MALSFRFPIAATHHRQKGVESEFVGNFNKSASRRQGPGVGGIEMIASKPFTAYGKLRRMFN